LARPAPAKAQAARLATALRSPTRGSDLVHVNIVCHRSAYGLAQDADLLADTLRGAGFRVTESELRGLPPLARLRRKLASTLRRGPLYDVNIFSEIAAAPLFPLARKNVLLPNPEFLRPDTAEHLSAFDAIFCKTHEALEIFNHLGLPAVYTGFSTPPPAPPIEEKSFAKFFHAGGSLGIKGTDALIDLWQRHPGWPRLTVTDTSGKQRPVRDNLEVISSYVPERAFRGLQHAHGVHLCPSEMEGYGHYIAEPMSMGNVVLTTDAPPMNELVTSDRGFLAATAAKSPHFYGTRYQIDIGSLERTIQRVVTTPAATLAEMGQRAQAWFESNDRRFRERLAQAVQKLVASAPSGQQS